MSLTMLSDELSMGVLNDVLLCKDSTFFEFTDVDAMLLE